LRGGVVGCVDKGLAGARAHELIHTAQTGDPARA
jgi:hypothetical protein